MQVVEQYVSCNLGSLAYPKDMFLSLSKSLHCLRNNKRIRTQ